MRRLFSRLLPAAYRSGAVTIPVIRLHGAIMAGGNQFRPSLSLAATAGMIEKAFSFKDAPAVAISVNSPGGSPVQSRLIYKRIRDLAAEKNKRVLVFVEDVAASGGYMIAIAGDEIVASSADVFSGDLAPDAVLADNLHGLEIDARCVEIAVFALALAAWRFPDENGGVVLVRPDFPVPDGGRLF